MICLIVGIIIGDDVRMIELSNSLGLFIGADGAGIGLNALRGLCRLSGDNACIIGVRSKLQLICAAGAGLPVTFRVLGISCGGLVSVAELSNSLGLFIAADGAGIGLNSLGGLCRLSGYNACIIGERSNIKLICSAGAGLPVTFRVLGISCRGLMSVAEL
ncbi:MAG: hypothetical protein MSJ26_10460, partial [Oscillospiraceae bacterium]|nr:hypothetical protein [Oscillospiraceae bacterium]